jgi:hypothetical protein
MITEYQNQLVIIRNKKRQIWELPGVKTIPRTFHDYSPICTSRTPTLYYITIIPHIGTNLPVSLVPFSKFII